MKPVVIDNFLDEQSFRNLQNVILGNDFTWFYINAIDYSNEEGDKFKSYFHCFTYSLMLHFTIGPVFTSPPQTKTFRLLSMSQVILAFSLMQI